MLLMQKTNIAMSKQVFSVIAVIESTHYKSTVKLP